MKRLIIIINAALVLAFVLTSTLASAPGSVVLSVDRLEGGFAVLTSSDGQCFAVPASVFDVELAEGQILRLSAVSDQEARMLREQSNGAMLEGLAGKAN